MSRLLAIPKEIRDEIFAYCGDIGEDNELIIAGSKFFLSQRATNGAWLHPPTVFFPPFLRTNRQVYDEGRAVIFRHNPVSIVLNEGSFLGRKMGLPVSTYKDHISIAGVPSHWNSEFRKTVHLIRSIRLYVVLGFEHENGLALPPPADLVKKEEIASVVKGALENLCAILHLSRNLLRVEVAFADIGSEGLRTGKEPCVLTPLTTLQGINDVKIEGVPEEWCNYLTKVMTVGKSQTNAELRSQALGA